MCCARLPACASDGASDRAEGCSGKQRRCHPRPRGATVASSPRERSFFSLAYPRSSPHRGSTVSINTDIPASTALGIVVSTWIPLHFSTTRSVDGALAMPDPRSIFLTILGFLDIRPQSSGFFFLAIMQARSGGPGVERIAHNFPLTALSGLPNGICSGDRGTEACGWQAQCNVMQNETDPLSNLTVGKELVGGTEFLLARPTSSNPNLTTIKPYKYYQSYK